MSVDVFLTVVRKKDGAPWASFWLGESGTLRAVQDWIRDAPGRDCVEKNRAGIQIVEITPKDVRGMLADLVDDFYVGHYADEAICFLDESDDGSDAYHWWLVMG
jgi:hypothetical protein